MHCQWNALLSALRYNKAIRKQLAQKAVRKEWENYESYFTRVLSITKVIRVIMTWKTSGPDQSEHIFTLMLK